MKTIALKVSLLLLVISLAAPAQDTIFFRNNSLVSAKITEVGIREIKYKRFDNPDGPTYSNYKSEVARIRYMNGITDTIASIDSVKTDRKSISPGRDQLVLNGTELYYDNKPLGAMKARSVLKHRSLSANQAGAIKEMVSIKRKQQGYNALGTGFFVTGFAVPAVVTLGVLFDDKAYANQNAVNEVVAGAITGALFRIAGHVIVKINKNKSRARLLAFLKKHHQNEVIY